MSAWIVFSTSTSLGLLRDDSVVQNTELYLNSVALGGDDAVEPIQLILLSIQI
jgi:hypothetical protein